MASATLVGRDHRIDDRYLVDLTVTLRAYRVTPIDARMVDISNGGALVALDSDEIERGDEIVLAAPRTEIVATIAWSEGGFCGLVFHRKLCAAEIGALRRAGQPRSAH